MRQFLKITSIFALALVFTAGMAFGQDDNNEATVNQDGNNSEATVTQTSDGILNSAVVNQNGGSSNHVAKITQTSTAAESEDDANEVTLNQFRRAGFSSEAYIEQGNTSDFPSARAGNQVNLNQRGNTRADIKQGRTSTLEGYFGDFAIQSSNGAKSTIDVSQAGGDATVGVDQRGTSHEIIATQGSGNNHDAQFLQRGSNHLAKVTQDVTGKEAEVRQFGSGHETVIAQGLESSGGVQSSVAYVEQNGVNHRTDVIQNGGWNDADVTQTGSNGTVTINQTGSESVVE